MSSRVIVKNLPKHATEDRLREHFAAFGEVTDCRLKQTKDGRSRNFGFVGFRREGEAKEAAKQLNRSFFDTARITVEAAHAPGSEALGRPWSRYAPGSSAHRKLHPELNPARPPDAAKQAAKRAGFAAKAPPGAAPGAAPGGPAALAGVRRVRTATVKPNKAGVGTQRVHVEFASSGEEEGQGEENEGPAAGAAARTALAFEEGLSDLAYLRRKSAAAAGRTAPEASGGDVVDAGAKVRGKGKRRAKAQAATAAAEVGEENAQSLSADPVEEPAAGRDSTPAKAPPNPGDLNAGDEDGEATGRLYITNLPYGTMEEELRAHFETLGEVSSLYVCKDEDTLKSRGFGYVTYVFPECAARAQAELDLQPFQGRILRVAPARAKPAAVEPDASKAAPRGRTSSYKRNLADRQKRVDAHLQHTWNLLYVSASAAADAASKQLGIAKGELFGKDAENVALTAALTETSIIQQTKRWLQKEGIRVEAFEQSGPSLAKSRPADGGDGKRRDDTFIVKHLPAGAKLQELRERFARFGDLVRCSLAPSGTVAIVQYTDKTQAQRAFQKLAFSRYMHVPLYLELAPEDVFTGAGAAAGETAGGATGSTAAAGPLDGSGKVEEDAEEEPPRGCLFVKNLSFATTDEGLRSAFRACPGLRSAVVMKKKAAVSKAEGEAKAQLSMGYGFVEFDTPANAAEALKRRQGTVVDGHAVELQVSQRGAQRAGQAGGGAARNKTSKGALSTQRLCVRNLAFEATRKELHQLFGAYGSVTAVRVPKKGDYTGHRGFAFVDFASKSEAAAAYEALQHTHLYGRRMVIEPAEEAATDVGSAQSTAQRRQAAQGLHSEAKRRRRAGVLNASGEGQGGSFEEAFT